MPSTPSRCVDLLRLLSLVFFALALASPPAHAEPAATAQFVFGTVFLVATDGSQQPLSRAADIQVGETIVTGADGRAHLRFTDGGFVALTPDSEFRIDDYRYTGQADPSDRVSMSLLKGGLRTISGLIGKITRDAYQMATRVGTIGIRGTEYTILYAGQSVTGTVASGRIEVCNSAGCLELGQGQSYFLMDENTKPVLTERAAFLAPPQPRNASKIDDSRRTPESRAGRVRSSDSTGKGKGNGGEVGGIVHDGDHPGRGWGAGGNPSANNESDSTGKSNGGGVSGIVLDGDHPGQGWGVGGNPSANNESDSTGKGKGNGGGVSGIVLGGDQPGQDWGAGGNPLHGKHGKR